MMNVMANARVSGILNLGGGTHEEFYSTGRALVVHAEGTSSRSQVRDPDLD